MLERLKRRLELAGNDRDALLGDLLEEAEQYILGYTGRRVLPLALEGAVLYLSCGATMEQIRPIADQTADQGGLVRMLVPLVVAVGVVGQALYVLPLTRDLSDFVTLLASVLQVACHACFVRFLFQCRKVVAPVAR